MLVTPFHLAIPVTDLEASMEFYGIVLGCEQGRSSADWIDWNFYGHQLVTHKVEQMPMSVSPNEVDSKAVPIPHFGVVLEWQVWQGLADRLVSAQQQFVFKPYIRFVGEIGEQATMFLLDPCGNAIEFKAFRDIKQLFAK
jgi:extradiol dioxygenase family protein